MKIQEVLSQFRQHQKYNLKQKTMGSYRYILDRFEERYGERSFESIGPDDVFDFLELLTENLSKSTRRLRYAQLKAFYNFAIEKCAVDFKNPCSYPLLSKSFRAPRQVEKKILDKEVVEEMIYNVRNKRDRLILELQARCGLRVGELLKITASDVSERKLLLREPKSGKDSETAFMPEQIARRLGNYIKNQNLSPNDRIFPITYATARNIVKRQGVRLRVTLTPHDLRRYSATYASRNGVPLEIISKVILRHQDLKTTQIYLGKVSESEAIRWMDILHGK
jgi:integrase/recombinase XerD